MLIRHITNLSCADIASSQGACTQSSCLVCSVYNEKRISVEAGEGEKIEYRVWNPFRSKLAASVLAGVDNVHIKPGGKVLYLGAASGTSVSHVSDIVGPTGAVFAVEFSHRSGERRTD